MANIDAKTYEADLLELKDKLFMIKLHAEKKGNLTKKQKKQMGLLNWNGKADVEQMCGLFMTFMTTPAVKTAEQLEAEEK